jgi:Uncharacterized protein conserved in bacteria
MAMGGLCPTLCAKGTGLPLPRFASLRANEVNLRCGPGLAYPIEWVYTQKYLPVKIISEYNVWRQIQCPEGTRGWVHQSMLSGRKMGLVHAPQGVVFLRRTARATSAPIAKVRHHALGQLKTCTQKACQMTFGGIKGWLPRSYVWGAPLPAKSPSP